ncbi:alpha-glycosidase [Paraliobacillus ryukyuensis]
MMSTAICHRAVLPYVYGKDEETVEIMLETKKDMIKKVELIYADPYNFKGDNWQYQLSDMYQTGSTATIDYWKIEIKPPYRRLRYGFHCTTAQNESIIVTERGYFEEIPKEIGNFYCFPYLHENDVFQAPSWVKDTVWYQIFPERFGNGDPTINPEGTLPWASTEPTSSNFFGGDFQGVINHLDYLVELGINGIYFTPIFKAYSNHKYDTIDYMEIDPQFGDKDTFRELVRACHQRGIKVMLDAVFNHSGYYFKPFQDVLQKQTQSSYKDWFHLWEFPVETEPSPNYDAFGFVATMPKLNTANTEVRNYLLNVAKYWIEEFDIDGWRLDVANEVDHAFWRDFRNVVKSVKPDAYILGEIWHDSLPWLQGDQFDAVMNYPFTNSVIEFFAKQDITAKAFAHSLTSVLHMYPTNVNEVSFNLLDSHDTPRILTLAGNDKRRMRLLYLFQLSFIGTPCLYYGDEIGMIGGEDPGCRACMVWDETFQDRQLFIFVKQLIHLRKTIPAFGNKGNFRFLSTDDETNIIVYEKFTEDEQIIFILNNNEKNSKITVPQLENKAVKELTTNKKSTFEKDTIISLEPYDFYCFKIVE